MRIEEHPQSIINHRQRIRNQHVRKQPTSIPKPIAAIATTVIRSRAITRPNHVHITDRRECFTGRQRIDVDPKLGAYSRYEALAEDERAARGVIDVRSAARAGVTTPASTVPRPCALTPADRGGPMPSSPARG